MLRGALSGNRDEVIGSGSRFRVVRTSASLRSATDSAAAIATDPATVADSVTASRGTGLLVRLRRPSVAQAARSFEEAGRCVTTLLGRRRPSSEPEQMAGKVVARGCPP